ncbi:DNA mismatch repair protein MutS [Candidatus Gracilibacteria bacterium]|nr:DNA mismatch repair protein MutS [Candidatus Gracilibacteria bacterium]
MSKITLHNWYRQYQQLKEQAADAVLFFRFGDFYETFDDDAKLIAALLDVTLTRKDFAVDKSLPKETQTLYAPMAGMPYHAVERYVAELISRGYRVAIAEQLSETDSSRSDTRRRSIFAHGITQGEKQHGMVHREIVRVITPGTVIDPSLLNSTSNNYLVAVLVEGGRVGLAYADLSTGEFCASEFGGERATQHLQSELVRLQAAEVLVPDDEDLRLPHLAPASAQLSHDLAPMTKGEREHMLPHERVARKLDQASDARWAQGHVTAVQSWRWELRNARDTLLKQFGTQSLSSFGLEDKPLACRAAGAIVQYVRDTQRHRAAQLNSIRVYTSGSFMLLDPQTRRNLELLESSTGQRKSALISVLDRTKTPMGARLIRRWIAQPLLELAPLHARQEAVAALVEASMARAALREALAGVGDMERAINRITQGTSVATPRDLVQLRQALRCLPAVLAAVEGQLPVLLADVVAQAQPAGDAPIFTTPLERERRNGKPAPRAPDDDLFGDTAPTQTVAEGAPTLDMCADVLAILEHALDDDPPALLGVSNYLRSDEGGERPRRVIRAGYDERMDVLVAANRDAQRFIDELEQKERERTGIKSLKVGFNNVFGYYIEISRTVDTALIPRDYERRQTLVNAERYVTEQLKYFEGLVNKAKLQIVELEREAFGRICEAAATQIERLRAAARATAQIDTLACLAETAVRNRYIRPTLHENTRLTIKGGRHPVVEMVLDEAFVANDVVLDTAGEQLLIITGPNMAGKSTVLRQVALIVLLAQIGSFVPADEATIGLVDRIFTRIGAQDDIATGQSTFMVEMTETAALLLQSTRRSLIILDEVGRGTSTYDGMAIARAVIEYLHNEPRLQCRTLFATHYHELTALQEVLPRVYNYHMAAVEQEGQVVFLHELRAGGADRSYGIHVAELAGIPQAVIRRASELLAELEGQAVGATVPTATRQIAVPAAPEPVSASKGQLSLFDVAPSPVVNYLRTLDINALTPMDAMMKLYELQKLAKGE